MSYMTLSVFMSYMIYGPPYLIWNRYLMVPLTLYGTGIMWSSHMYIWSATCEESSVLYGSYDPPIPYME